MATANNITAGSVFGRWTVLSAGAVRVGKKNPKFRAAFKCRCECGQVKDGILGYNLLSGCSMSCGCIRKELMTRHGDIESQEYCSWKSLRHRCLNPNDASFRNYGGRGITVCERWHSYENFLADMGRKPTPEHTIERVDNNRGYEPGNCVWATDGQQARNRRFNHWITVNGDARVLTDWARMIGIDPSTLGKRIARGWPEEEAVKVPAIRNGKRRTYRQRKNNAA